VSRVVVALVHYPVVDREGRIITTAITNLDLHDIARSACTYGVSDLLIVHPVAAQRELAERVRSHWVEGSGAKRIPTREPAMRLLRVVAALDDVYEALGGRDSIEVVATTARTEGRRCTTFASARERVHAASGTVLLLFGTGWGLAPDLLDGADVLLEAIAGSTGYNHLSVRAACAIALDRLLGPRGPLQAS
jgi:hypothetical protein